MGQDGLKLVTPKCFLGEMESLKWSIKTDNMKEILLVLLQNANQTNPNGHTVTKSFNFRPIFFV